MIVRSFDIFIHKLFSPHLFLIIFSLCFTVSGQNNLHPEDRHFFQPTASSDPNTRASLFINRTTPNSEWSSLVGNIDATFNASATEGSGYVKKLLTQPDGKIITVGYFQRVNGTRTYNITRLNADGSTDTTFQTGTGVLVAAIEAAVIQPDGKIIVGGGFTSFNGQPVNGIARLNTNGSLDTSFVTDALTNPFINEILLLPNGKILVSGNFIGFNTFLIRLNGNGSFDTVIEGFNQLITSMALSPDGKIVVGGNFTAPRANVARLNADGSVDTTFNPTTGANNQSVGKVLVQSNGKVLVAGNFTSFNSTPTDALVRLNENGTVDTPFEITAETSLLRIEVSSLAVQNDGKILAGYNFTNSSLQYSVNIRRFNSDATVDSSFNTGANSRLNAADLRVQSDGTILVGGFFFTANNQRLLRLLKLNSNGSLVNDFTPAISSAGIINAIERQPDGKIIVAGNFLFVNGIARNLIARLNQDGSLDNTFNPSAELFGEIYDVAVLPNGKIVIGGIFGGTPEFPASSFARLNADGSLDTGLSPPNLSITAFALTPQNDGKILVGGEIFNRASSNPPPVLIRLNTDGSFDNTFSPFAASNVSVRDILVQPNGKIIVGGRFNFFNAPIRQNILRLDASGALDTGFSSTTQSEVYSLSQQPDGKVYAAGFGIRRYTADGAPDGTFSSGSGINGTIYDVEPLSNDKILIGGVFSTYNGTPVKNTVRLNNNGSVDVSFGSSFPDYILEFSKQPDGKLIVGGRFLDFNGTEKFSLVRIQNPLQNQTLFDYDGDGKADVSVFRPASGVWYLNNSSTGFLGVSFGSATDSIVPADFDGDGKTDVSVFRGGNWYILNSSNNSFSAVSFGQAGDVPMPADYDGDGKADQTVFRNGNWYLNRSFAGFAAIAFGQSGDKPVAGDFDGDAKADVAVFRNGNWYYLRSSDNGFAAVAFGNSTDVPVAADYDGDGKTDPAVYRSGNWYLLQSQNGFAAVSFGIATDRPAPADYDGDGKSDVAVFRDGNWYLLQSTGGFASVSFGTTNDKPTPAAFIP